MTPRLLIATVLAAPLLAGCGNSDISRTFGFTRDPPDEFQVATRAPLALPPDFALRPPRPGTVRPQEGTAPEQAQALFTGGAIGGPRVQAARSTASASRGEAALLAQAGPAADPALRGKLDTDTSLLESRERGFADRLVFWRTPAPSGITVDPQREQQRLRENAALGRTSSDGDTPIIQRRSRGLLEGLF